MTIEMVIFFVLAGVTIATSVAAVAGKNLFHSALSFGLFLLAQAGLYFILTADFVAITQIFVYVGGVVVLIVFGIMLTSRIAEVGLEQISEQREVSLVATLALAVVLVVVLNQAIAPLTATITKKATTHLIGRNLLSNYVLPFEVVAVLLLVAMVAAIVMAREEAS